MEKEKDGFKIPEKKTIPAMEDEILSFWRENRVFEKSVESRPENDRFVFVDGPPFVSGSPHYAHLLVSIAKDLFPRYWTMKGKRVRRVFGWDCHGLPIEAKINEKFNLRSRRQVEEFGVDRYVAECREFVKQQMSDWRWYIDKVGRWVDLDKPYRTMDWQFGESVIWAFKKMYEQGLIYKGKRTSLYSTDTATPVSEFEVSMDPDNYKEVEEESVFMKFSLKKHDLISAGKKPVSLLSWTTTPWTLPANFAVAVNPAYQYVLAEVEGELLVLAEDLLNNALENRKFNVLESFSGEKLIGSTYEPLFDFYNNQISEKDYHVYASDGVTNTEGTGVLHVAPGFGELDFNLGIKNGVSSFTHIDDEGIMQIGPYKGVYIRKASALITEDLKKSGKIFRTQMYKHRLPFYRGKSPLIYVTQEAYFVDLREINKKILEKNREVNWIPEYFRDGRFREVVETAPDWCVSRNRYWGTVMPIWKSVDGEELVIGSIADLLQYTDQIEKREKTGSAEYYFNGQILSFHRDIMDKIILKKDGKEFRRVPEILDVWLDSGSVPFAEYHYPFENKDLFEKNFPAGFIIEYTGQIRAWFQILFRVAVALFDRAPYQNVVVTGVLSGTDGRKMSKSFGNYPDPKNVLNSVGGDALRLYFMSSPLMLGENANLNETELNNKARNVLNTYWNSAVYFLTYAREFEFEASDAKSENPLDMWISARLNETLTEISNSIEKYVVPPAVRAMEDFITDLSTWYIRRSRERIAGGNKQALATLYVILLKATKAFAPVLPFMTEKIYQELKKGGKGAFLESVHLENYPGKKIELSEKEIALLRDMETVRAIASVGQSIRKEKSIAIKQPLACLRVSKNVKLSSELMDILADELNVKKVELGDAFAANDRNQRIGDEEIMISLDAEITEELKTEGELRSLVRQIQKMRQDTGLTMSDMIFLQLEKNATNEKILAGFKKELAEKIGAKEIVLGEKTEIKKTPDS